MLQALIDKRIGRRDQAQAWVWRLAEYTRELHEEYAVQRWPETKRLLGLLVNSSGRAHGRNARRLVHAARKQDRRLAVALLAAAVSHTPEGEEVLRGAKMRMARKPSGVARELLRNFPKGGKRRRKRKRGGNEGGNGDNGGGSEAVQNGAELELDDDLDLDDGGSNNGAGPQGERRAKPKRQRQRRGRSKAAKEAAAGSGAGATPSGADRNGDAATGDHADDGQDGDVKSTKRKAPKPKADKPKAAKDKADKPKAAKRKRKPKAANDAGGTGSEGGQVDVAGAEGDAVSIGESDE
jgi:hypothetical protein